MNAPRGCLALGLVLLLLPLTACAPKGPKPPGGQPDTKQVVAAGSASADVGDWEAALSQYRAASAASPDDASVRRKLLEAQHKVSDIRTKRAEDANAGGRIGDAGELWREAIELLPEEERRNSQAWADVESNLSALEYFGDSAITEERPADAVAVFGVLALVHPDKPDLVEKAQTARKKNAVALTDVADGLYRRDLPGAALITELRALEFDPLQSRAFQSSTELKKLLRKRSKVDVSTVKIEDAGYKQLAGVLGSKVTPHLDDYPPFGKAPAQLKVILRITIESFSKDEFVTEGVDELPNEEPPSTIPIPNPQVQQLQEKVEKLQKKLADLQSQLKAYNASKKGKGGAKKPAGSGSTTTPADDPGLQLARDIDKTRVDIASAQARISQLPATVMPPPPDPTWKLPWTKTTRSMTARVRFELQDSDFAESSVVEVEKKVEKSDRAHKGSEKHNVPADPLQLPSYDEIAAELADQLVVDGVVVIGKDRDRRIQNLADRGHTMQTSKDPEQAEDAFVGLLYQVGLEKMPPEAIRFLSDQLGETPVKDLLDSPAAATGDDKKTPTP